MKKPVDVKIFDKRLLEPQYELKYGTPGSAGLDLRACIDGPLALAPGESALVPSGIAIHLDDVNYAAMLLPRSGLGVKHRMVITQKVGLIDSDYQDQMFIPILNESKVDYIIQPMDRICQMVVVPVIQVELNVVDSFDASARGLGGFGSTGKN